jgi:hypothetical protein
MLLFSEILHEFFWGVGVGLGLGLGLGLEGLIGGLRGACMGFELFKVA